MQFFKACVNSSTFCLVLFCVPMRRKLKYSHPVLTRQVTDGFGEWLSVRVSYVFSLTKLLSCVTLPCLTYFTCHTKYIIHNINIYFQWNIIISQQLQLRILRKQSTKGHAIFILSEKFKHVTKSPVLHSQKTKCTKITITNILLLFN